MERSPYAFAIAIQGNPKVSKQIAELAWGQRPSFLLHPGDLVSTGKNRDHWLKHFFPGMRPLINHVPFYPVLGNHEQNAKHYYDYVSLPDPEYYYAFDFGNARFFMVDTNQKVDRIPPIQVVGEGISASKAKWKFVATIIRPILRRERLRKLMESNKKTRTQGPELVPLYEKHGVDLV